MGDIGTSIPRFHGSGFATFKARIRPLFMHHGLWDHVQGKEEKPNASDAAATEEWRKRSCKGLAILTNALGDSQLGHIQDIEEAHLA